MTSIKRPAHPLCSNIGMYPVLHAVARIVACPSSRRDGLAHEVSEALADETRVSMATRLGLVALATRLEAGDRCGSERPAPGVFDRLADVPADGGDDRALQALVAIAPQLRAMADDLASRGDPCALAPSALLELLATRLH